MGETATSRALSAPATFIFLILGEQPRLNSYQCGGLETARSPRAHSPCRPHASWLLTPSEMLSHSQGDEDDDQIYQEADCSEDCADPGQ